MCPAPRGKVEPVFQRVTRPAPLLTQPLRVLGNHIPGEGEGAGAAWYPRGDRLEPAVPSGPGRVPAELAQYGGPSQDRTPPGHQHAVNADGALTVDHPGGEMLEAG